VSEIEMMHVWLFDHPGGPLAPHLSCKDVAAPGEQQTEITRRHFPQMIFYRLDKELKENIGLDDVGGVDRLREYGEQLSEEIDREAILAGTDTTFRIGSENTRWHQYAQPAV
jgi:hypothetical protein